MQSFILRAITRDGSARLIFADTTEIVREAQRLHGTSKTATAAFGRCLTAASLMGSMMKDADNSLTLQIKGDGPIGTILCVSDYCGNVKGYVENPQAEVAPNAQGKLNVSGIVGNGTLYVIKDLGLAEPYIGMTPLVTGEIAEDVTEYFAISEQVPTICALGVRCDTDNTCTAAGGFLVQLLPFADEGIIPILENNISAMGSVSSLIGEPCEIIGRIFKDIEYDLFDRIEIGYVCDCSRERYHKALMSLSADDLDELRESGEPIETCCRFCNKKYVFEVEELT